MELRDYVIQYQNGRPDAFDEIFIRSKDDFYRYAYMVAGKNEELINDAIQDTYIQIIHSIGSLDDPDKFIPWGKTILRNKIYAFYRKNGKELTISKDDDEEGADFFDRLEDDDEALIPGNELDREEVRSIIREVVRELPEKQRVVVCLYYLDEMPVADIAIYLQISEGTVKSRLYKAREAIRARIEAYEKKYDVRLHVLALPFALLHKSLANLPKDFQMGNASANAIYKGCQSALTKAAEAVTGASALGAGAASAGAAGKAAESMESRAVGGASDAVRRGSSAQNMADRLVRESASQPKQQAVQAGRAARHAAEKNAGQSAGSSAGKAAVKKAAGKTAGKSAGKSAAAAAGKAAGSGAAKKIVAGVLAVALAAGGGYGGYTYYSRHHTSGGGQTASRSVNKTDTKLLDVDTDLSKGQIMNDFGDVMTDLLNKESEKENQYMESDDFGTENDHMDTPVPYISRDFDHDGILDMLVFNMKNYDSSNSVNTYIVVRTPKNVQVITDTHQESVEDPWVVTASKDLKTIRLAYYSDASEGCYFGAEYKYKLSPNDHKTMIYTQASASDSGDSSSDVESRYVKRAHAFRVTDQVSENAKDCYKYAYASDLENLLLLSGINVSQKVDADNWKDAYRQYFTSSSFPVDGEPYEDDEQTADDYIQGREYSLYAKDINQDGVPEIFISSLGGTVIGDETYMITYLNGRIRVFYNLFADGIFYTGSQGEFITDGVYASAGQVTTAGSPGGAMKLKLEPYGLKLIRAAAKSYTPDSEDASYESNHAKGMLNFQNSSEGTSAYNQLMQEEKSGSFSKITGWQKIKSEAEAKSFIEQLCK